MSLATRCTACGTIFRVVQDQLRVSEGFVRCGRCAEVFDAREQLFDIDRDAPPPWPALPQGGIADTQLHHATPEPADAMDERDRRNEAELENENQQEEPLNFVVTDHQPEPDNESESEHLTQPDLEGHSGSPDAHRVEPQWVDEARREPAASNNLGMEDGTPDVLLSKTLASHSKAATAAARAEQASKPTEKPAEQALPTFLRKSASETFWQRGAVRAGLGFAALLLLAALSLQLLRHFHNAIAAVFPQSQAVLQSYCQFAGCELKPWQRIAHISVESTALSQLAPASNDKQGNHYQLAVSLRNKGPFELATPWVELSLTDSTGTLISRRLLAPSEFRAERAAAAAGAANAASAAIAGRDLASMAAGTELGLQALLSTGQQRVSGYSVEIFYP